MCPGNRTVDTIKNLDYEGVRRTVSAVIVFEREAWKQKKLVKRKLYERFDNIPAYEARMH